MSSNLSSLLEPHRYKLLALTACVLVVHGGMLLLPHANFWRLQVESPKLGPLQTRILMQEPLSNATPSTAKASPKARQVPKPKAPETTTPSSTPASMTAMASTALPAPEAPPQEIQTITAENPLPVATEKAAEAPSSNMPAQTPVPTRLPAPEPSPADTASVKTGTFPDNVQINYKLTGQERGLTYYASGALKWQTQSSSRTRRAYEAELRVKAFLIGSRVWRSVGVITENGLAPTRYSDSGRGERAAHFETDLQKISFSGNTPSTPLQAGAQDQVSLFFQMASAVTAQSFKPGSELIVQTATSRDAVNWRLSFKEEETLEWEGKRLETQRWVCLPRGRFDSQIEMWLSKEHAGVPVRIKISQANGNFIDMEMTDVAPLQALPD